MKQRYKKILAGILAATLALGLAGCGGSSSDDKLVYLDYGTGIDETGAYNNELYGMNNNDVNGADPGCIYVSEEDDPIYGGYFYMYLTGWTLDSNFALNTSFYEEEGVDALAFPCFRSKNLYQWEQCGSLPGGYSLQVDKEDWCSDDFWAPEILHNPSDGKYYMYFSSLMDLEHGVPGLSTSSNEYDRYYLCAAVSDSPMGPFDIIYDTDLETGKRVPTFDFKKGCNIEFDWPAIDISPFIDDNGDLYMYFVKHRDSHYDSENGLWGMKMLSLTQPDYSTVTCLGYPNKVTASSEPGEVTSHKASGEYFFSEDNVNEGPTMLKHNGKYYLTYTANGYASQAYSVHQAVGDSPLGEFKKLDAAEGNPVLNGSAFGFMVGTGHHCFVEAEGELFMLYHRHDSIYTMSGRAICADRVNWVTNQDGLEVLAANGPSKSLQWIPEGISGYRNLTKDASVSTSTGQGIEYLTDGYVPFNGVFADYVLKAEGEDVTVHFKWDEPVKVSSIMIYNGQEVSRAFSKVSDIRFKLAERPEWATKDYAYAVIKDLELPRFYWNAETEEYIAGAPAVAEFDEIMVTEIEVTVSATDRLVKVNKQGEDNTSLSLSEIVILGGVE